MLKQKEWIETIVSKIGCTKAEAKTYYDCVFEYLQEQISPEENIKISGFGVLKLRRTAAKEQINLVTGQAEIVPEHNVIIFKPYFEIDPKPEAIEIEDEDIVVADAPVAAEAAPAEEPEEAEEVEEEAVAEEPAKEEAPAEEPAPVEEPAPAEEAAPVEEPAPAEEDKTVWIFGDKHYTTDEFKDLLKNNTNLTDDEINSAVDVVKARLKEAGKDTCEVNEKDDSFDVVFAK